MNLKDPIEIIHLIRTLLDESIEEAIRTDNIEKEVEDEYEFWKESIVRVYNQIDNKLLLLDIALTNLKIENEVYYYKLKDILSELDIEIQEYYTQKEEIAPYPTLPPITIKKHITEMEKFQYFPKSNDFKQNESVENSKKEEIEVISEIELTRIKDKVAMLIELGIIDHLILKYPHIKGVALRLTKLLSPILDIEVNSLKKIINAFVTDAKKSTDYPKITVTVKNAVDKLTLEK